MSFIIDKQTLEDLNIFTKRSGPPIYSLYNRTITLGGAAALDKLFREPLSDAHRIQHRSRIIHYLYSSKISFPFTAKRVEQVELYLSGSVVKHIRRHILMTCKFIQEARKFLDELPAGPGLEDFQQELAETRELLRHSKLADFVDATHRGNLGTEETADGDYFLRVKVREQIEQLLGQLYEVDALIGVASTARVLNLTFASVRPPSDGMAAGNRMIVKNLRHPAMADAVANDVSFDAETHMMFLTGANRAGKSTFMKSLGLAVYLAHLGFPVKADTMECTALDGLMTTINLSDHLNIGFSHFYSEVYRVKQVARHLAAGRRLLVIFDELFRGTNVKDAYEATVQVSKALAQRPASLFVISTHIIEAADELRPTCPSIAFARMRTEMQGQVPHYTYKLAPGISDDRHGMMILTQEGILDILAGRLNS